MEIPYKLEICLYHNVSLSSWKAAEKELSSLISLICKDEGSAKNYSGEYKSQHDSGRWAHLRRVRRLKSTSGAFTARTLICDHYGVIDVTLLDIILNCPGQQEWTDDIHPFYDKGYREVQASDIIQVLENTRDNGLGWLHEFVLSKTINCPEKLEVRFTQA